MYAQVDTNIFIIKTDVEDMDCQVLSDEQIFDKHFVPYIFVEWNNNLKSCSSLKLILEKSGYTPMHIQEYSVQKASISCLFLSRCIKYQNLLWIHKDAKKIWKIEEKDCECKCKSVNGALFNSCV